MRAKLSLLALLVPALASCASVPRLSPEAQLDKRLQGRVAGEPERCINLQQVSGVGVYDRTALVYDAGRTLYVNRPSGRAQALREFDTLAVRSFAGQLCRGEPVNLIDPTTRALRGFVILGDFVPYRRG